MRFEVGKEVFSTGIFGKFKMPKIDTSSFKLSDYGLPDINLNKIKIPDYKMSDFGLPDINMENINLRMPEMSLSDFGLPDLKSFKPDLSKIDLSKIGLDVDSFKITDVFSVGKMLKEGDLKSIATKYISFDSSSLLSNLDIGSTLGDFKFPNLNSIASSFGLDGVDVNKMIPNMDNLFDPTSLFSGLSSFGLSANDINIPDFKSIFSEVDMPDLGGISF